MTTRQEISGTWKSLVGAVKEKYGQITDDDLSRVEGNVDQLIGLVQQKSGQTRDQVRTFLRGVSDSTGSVLDRLSEYADTASETVRDGYNQVADQAKRGYEYSAKTVARHPFESVGTAFGVGIVAGIVIGMTIGAQRERELSWRERWMR